MKEIISCLDIGSSTMKLVVGEVYKNEVNTLSVSEVKSKGVKKGIIVNTEEAIVSLKELFRRSEETLGISVDKVILIVPSNQAEFINTVGEVDVDSEDGKVNNNIMIKLLQSCVYEKVPNNREFISIMTYDYCIDGEKKVDNLRGLSAKKVSCKGVISIAPKKNIYTAISILENIGVNVIDINFGSICDYYEFKNKKLDSSNTAIINIGDEKTEVSIFRNGILIDTEIIELGGNNIDRDICYIYNIDSGKARELKEKFALAHKRNASTSWSEDVLNVDNENIKISQYELSEIIYSRIKEILELSKKQINILTKLEISYIIILGGVSESNDFSLVVDEVFGTSAIPCRVKEIGCRHNKYSSALGFIKYYHEKLSNRDRVANMVSEQEQNELINNRKTSGTSLLGKIYGYFFNN